MNIRTLRLTSAMLGIVIVAAGCTTLDPYTREEQTSKATKGALIGAAAGVVVGLISGDDAVERRQRALIGAGVGALAGGSVGYYMDRQEAQLRAELEGTGVSVVRNGDHITLNMPGNVTFATNSADLNPAFFNVLNSVGKVLKEYNQSVVEVAGHTDSTRQQMPTTRVCRSGAPTRLPQYLQSPTVSEQPADDHRSAWANSMPRCRQRQRLPVMQAEPPRVEITMVPVTS